MTIETIETLGEEDALLLLELKWITPIQSGLETLPGEVISSMVSEIQDLEHKYATTYADIETEKRNASKSLIAMIGRLTGNGNDLNGLAEFKKYMEE